jgi:hypothetical protein
MGRIGLNKAMLIIREGKMKKLTYFFVIVLVVIFLCFPVYSANVLSGNPLVLDTTTDASGIPNGGLVTAVEYHPNAANDDVDLRDSASNSLFLCRAPIGAPNHEAEGIIERRFDPPIPVAGLYLVTIDGGTLYVYYHRTRP